MRAFDKYAIETCHVPGLVLMENAGRGAADVISAFLREQGPSAPSAEGPGHAPVRFGLGSEPVRLSPEDRIVVVCGAGNNGGDGFVVARHLLARGATVEVFLAGRSEKVMGDARIHHDAYIDLGGTFVELPEGSELAPLRRSMAGARCVVDALFGTGLDRPLRGFLAQIVELINEASCRCVALDVPSGLDADSGGALGVAILADATITFGHLKIGLLTPDGARLAGDIHVVDLGVPDGKILSHVGHTAEVIHPALLRPYFVPREANAHKHAAGNVLVIAGSPGKIGAAKLAAEAALRAGAGLVTTCTWPEAAAALEPRFVEVMLARLDRERLSASIDEALVGRHAVAIGPGFGLDEAARLVTEHVVLGWDGVKVVDADAISLFAGRADLLATARGRLVLTPHPGELGRLLGTTSRAIEQDRLGAVREAVRRTKATVVLKGARTMIGAPDGRVLLCMAGNPVLATAGSGDVLTGIVTAFACAMPPTAAAAAGVYVHALAGDAWRARTGSDRGLFAGELGDEVPRVLALLRATQPVSRRF
jgi:hydroxyethylthiazole kinase-like uncharacterized protein yjeF